MILDVLIPTLPERREALASLLEEIAMQIGEPLSEETSRNGKYVITIRTYAPGVRVITCMDRKQMTVGKKRNVLKTLVDADYFTYIDDDDKIEKNYFAEILAGTQTGKDLIVYRLKMHENGKVTRHVFYRLRYNKNSDGRATPKLDPDLRKMVKGMSKAEAEQVVADWPRISIRVPNHLMVWRSKIAKGIDFAEVNIGEDNTWAQAMRGKANSEYVIEKYIYNYMFDFSTSVAQNPSNR